MINKILSLFSHQDKNKAYLLVLALTFAAILEMLGVGLIMPFIALVQDKSFIESNSWAKAAYDMAGAGSYNSFIIAFSVLILAFYTLKNIVVGFIIHWQSLFLARAESEIARHLLDKYLSMPYEKYLSRNTAELVNNITVETSMLFAGLIKPLFIVISDTLVAAAILLLLLYIAPAATFAAIVTIGLSAGVFYIMLRPHLSRLGAMRLYHREKMVQWVNQGLGSLKEILVLGRKSFFINSFWQHASSLIAPHSFSETVAQLPRIVIESFGVIVLVVITIILLQQPGDFLPTIALFAMAAFRLMPAVNRITASATKVRYYMRALEVIWGDLNQGDRGEGNKGIKGNTPYPLPLTPSSLTPGFQKEIIISGISYTYPGTTTAVLEDISLVIKKGDSIGIIGPSGSGKSTFVDILLGLLIPQQGEILVDGDNIHRDMVKWRRNISYMPQVVYLTDDTIKRNIALGVPDDEIDDALVWESLKKAQLDDFIKSLPGGVETMVGERGSRLSGGQRQRIGIARALYNQPQILILDEATTALDPETEGRICATLKGIAKDITLIAISHQPALIAVADRVYKMENGRLESRI